MGEYLLLALLVQEIGLATNQFYGVLSTYPYGHSPEELVKRYGIPCSPFNLFVLYPGGDFSFKRYHKHTPIMQLPVEELRQHLRVE